MAERTFNTLFRRLSRAGFKSDFVRRALLPDWWSEECVEDSALLPEVEFRIAKFLDEKIDKVRDPSASLSIPAYSGAQFRHSRAIDRERLSIAVHAAVRVAEAAVRNLRDPKPPVRLPSALDWRRALLKLAPYPDLDTVVASLWAHGVPVLHLEELPPPRFQGMAVLVQGCPVIVIGHGIDIPAWLLFTVTHEAGHIANGHCEELAPVVDATDEPDSTDIERAADSYAFTLLNGQSSPFKISGATPKALAEKAWRIQEEHHVDAAHLVLAWARFQKSEDSFKTANLALKAMFRDRNGKEILRRHFDEHIALDGANESDRALLACIFLDPERNEGPH